jgi:hypothetical protein
MRFITETKAANKRKSDTVEIVAKKIKSGQIDYDRK